MQNKIPKSKSSTSFLMRRGFLGKGILALISAAGVNISSAQEAEETQSSGETEPFLSEPNLCKTSSVTPRKALVTYASMFGSTAGYAKSIADTFCTQGWQVDLLQTKDVVSVEGYAMVVVGSAIKGGQWLEECQVFVKNNAGALSKVPVAYYLSCMAMAAEDRDDVGERVGEWKEAIVNNTPGVKPVSFQAFPGSIDFKKLDAIQKIFYPIIAGNRIEGDFRNFKSSRVWANSLCENYAAEPKTQQS